jgi:inner membrane protein
VDNLTHSLIGALLGQAGLKRKTGLAMPALIIGANLPDVDAACFFWLDGVEHLGFRRGITHGPPALVLLPLILAGLLYVFDRWQAKRGKRPEERLPVSFKWLFLLSFIGCLTHPALDWLNSYGIRLLEPFSSQWFYGDTLFIIDVWLWALMGFATWFSIRREKRGDDSRRPALVAIVVGLAYIGLNGAITSAMHARDNDIVGHTVIASPVPFSFWQREMVLGQDGRYAIVDPAIESLDLGQSGPKDDADFIEIVGDCRLHYLGDKRQSNNEVIAFLFWSRAPFAERAPDGSVILRDARFYDPRARDNFSVPLPDVKCEPIR